MALTITTGQSRTSGDELVKQDATTLWVRHGSEGSDPVVTYRFDGVETRHTSPFSGSQIVIVSKAEWVGTRLRIAHSSVYPDGRKAESTEVWALDEEGHLIIKYSHSMQGKPATKGTITYRKAS